MKLVNQKLQSGFTLIETLVVIAIMLIITSMMILSFSSYSAQEALSKDQGKIYSTLQRARSLTLNSYTASQYGVHFASSSITLFKGTTYDSSDAANIVVALNDRVQVLNVAVSGGGTDVIFQRLTGKTTQVGTTTLSLISNVNSRKTISIYGTGLVVSN